MKSSIYRITEVIEIIRIVKVIEIIEVIKVIEIIEIVEVIEIIKITVVIDTIVPLQASITILIFSYFVSYFAYINTGTRVT